VHADQTKATIVARDEFDGTVSNDEASDEALLEAIQRHEQAAIETLYDRYGRACFALAYRIVNDYGIAEDVVQDAFLRVWRQASSYQSGRGSVKNWLFSIVHHRAIDVLRSRGDRPRRDLPLDSCRPALTSGAMSAVRSTGRRYVPPWQVCRMRSGRRSSWPILAATPIPRLRS
jgi:hypothetical protein